MTRLPVALNQRMANKQLAAERGIDGAVIHLARSHNRQTVKSHFLTGHHRALRFLPVRFAVAAFDQVLRQRLNPLGIDARRHAAPQPAGFHQFSDHCPFRRLFKQPRAGKDSKTGVACAGKLLFIGVFLTDM